MQIKKGWKHLKKKQHKKCWMHNPLKKLNYTAEIRLDSIKAILKDLAN